MNKIIDLENFKYNADDYIFANGDDYTVVLNDSLYYLDKEKLELYNSHNKVLISKEIKDHIIEECLKDLPL